MSAQCRLEPEPRDLIWNACLVDLLAGLFIAPLSLPVVANYRSGLGAVLIETIAAEPGCAAAIAKMQQALQTHRSSLAQMQTLAVAFSRLFDGAAGSQTVSLYESGHVSASGRLFQEPVGAMNLLLQAANLSISAETREPPDHLSIELALLADCLRHEQRHDDAAALLDAHLLRWVPQFADQCATADRTGFYAGAAEVLQQILSTLREVLRAPVSARVITLHPARVRERAETIGAFPCPSE